MPSIRAQCHCRLSCDRIFGPHTAMPGQVSYHLLAASSPISFVMLRATITAIRIFRGTWSAEGPSSNCSSRNFSVERRNKGHCALITVALQPRAAQWPAERSHIDHDLGTGGRAFRVLSPLRKPSLRLTHQAVHPALHQAQQETTPAASSSPYSSSQPRHLFSSASSSARNSFAAQTP